MKRRPSPPTPADGLLLAALLLVAALAAAPLLAERPADTGRAESGPATKARDATGTARDVDADVIRRRLLEGRLSDHEAKHYHRE